jgi:hypothetical protein
MPKHYWIVNGPRGSPLPLVQVRAADACCLNLNNYIIVTANWTIYFTNFNAMRFG